MSSKSQYNRSRLAKIERGKVIPPGVQDIMDLVTKTSTLLGIETDPPGKVLSMKRETWMLVALSHAANRICILESAMVQLLEKVENLETRQMPERYQGETRYYAHAGTDGWRIWDSVKQVYLEGLETLESVVIRIKGLTEGPPSKEDQPSSQSEEKAILHALESKMCAFCKIKPVTGQAVFCSAECVAANAKAGV